MEPSRRWGGWRVVAPVLLVVLAALGVLAVSCTGGSSTGALPEGPSEDAAAEGGGPSEADVAALDDPEPSPPRSTSTTGPGEPSTTVAGEPGSTSPDGTDPGAGVAGGSGAAGPGTATTLPPASAADCGALQLVVIPGAAIITDEDFVPAEERTPVASPTDQVAAVQRVAAVVPERHRAAWRAVATSVAEARSAGRSPTPEEVAAFRAARNAVEVWARAVCPGAPPSWQCDHFGSAGNGPDVAPTRPQATTAAGALRRNSNAEAAEELVRADGAVLYGWVDDAGFVTRTVQVERVGDGWATARVHVCHDDP